jgi:heme A synthase
MKKPNGEKLKFRFNFIDFILIFVILAAAALLAYVFMSSDISLLDNNKKVEIEYKVEIKQVREEFRDYIAISDRVTDTVTQYALGEVVNVEYAPTRYTGVNHTTGELVFSDYPEHIEIIVTIRAQATANGDVYSLDGYKVAVGKAIAMRVPDFIGEGYCTQLTEVAANG